MSLVNQTNLETSAAVVTSDGVTAIAAGNFVPVAIAANLEQRLREMREAATLAVNARGFGDKEAARERLAASLTITAPLPNDALCTVIAGDESILVGESTTITVTLLDAAGRPVPNRPVNLTSDGASIISAGGLTNSAGVIVFSITGTVAQTDLFTAHATADALFLADTASIVVSAP